MSEAAVLVARLRAAGCVFAEDEAALLAAAADGPALEALVARRVSGEPLEQVLGWAAFCGLRVPVEPGVFVPRRRTELLAQTALAAVRTVRGVPVVLELCCGSGAVSAVLVAAVPHVELLAVDLEPAAVRCAALTLGPDRVLLGDLYAPVPAALRGRVDIVVANAPYVPSAEIARMPPEARVHEPLVALDGGGDGLDVQRRLVAEAPAWLTPAGELLVETSRPQAARLAGAVRDVGLTAEVLGPREDGGTVVRGRRPVLR